jgi:SAM-dependent methyltransferase
MPSLEQTALRLAEGRILDVGAGSGCHSLALLEMGKDVMSIDISPLAVNVMLDKGIDAQNINLFDEKFKETFDTVLMLMNGSGIIGRLENMEMFFKKMKQILAPGGCVLMDSSDLRYLYEDEDGSFVATLEESDDCFIGNVYDERGYVSREKQIFKKSEWHTVFKGGDGMISIHIPHGAKFDEYTVNDSIQRTKEILERCYPEYDYKTFFCGSWLLDPQLCDILKPESNIVKFCKRFKPLAIQDAGTCVFSFVFRKPNMDFEISELPETTSLERAIKNHYLCGKAIYEYFGYFLP